MHRNWRVNRTNPEFLQYLSDRASISRIFAQILVNRGIKDAESIKNFLYPSLEDLHNPFLLPDMAKAVDRVKLAIAKKETVLVHGDYDADGVTATAVLISSLKKFGLDPVYHIPNRMSEGYGISDTGIEKASACGASLIITGDCGITARDEVLKARAKGIDVIITDHHEPSEELPEALAVIDPHRKDSEYPFKFLAGVGVAFKLVQALLIDRGLTLSDSGYDDMLDLVALGTVADSVPLVGENRILVTYGLKKINMSPCRIGLKAIKDLARIDGEMRAGQLSYTIIPRINAAGRIDDAGTVVELLLTDESSRAEDIASLLDQQNRKRQKIEGDVLKSALEMIDPVQPDSAIVLSSPDWHPGVVGIVASRLISRFYRPVFLFSEEGSIAKGSARGIPPFHLLDAVTECSDMLIAFGGHRQAAGLKLHADKLSAFREKMNSIVERTLSAEDFVPELRIDASVKLSEINYNLVRELSLLEPFGDSNAEPVFGARSTEITRQRIVGNNHLKIMVQQESISMDAIGFAMGEQLAKIDRSPSVDIAFVPGINEWNGTRSLQLNLKAIRPGNR